MTSDKEWDPSIYDSKCTIEEHLQSLPVAPNDDLYDNKGRIVFNAAKTEDPEDDDSNLFEFVIDDDPSLEPTSPSEEPSTLFELIVDDESSNSPSEESSPSKRPSFSQKPPSLPRSPKHRTKKHQSLRYRFNHIAGDMERDLENLDADHTPTH
jgi:hypothetical protein